jgi:reactive intermediate/imine deaminase
MTMTENRKAVIHTDQAPAAIGPYAQAIRVGDTVYLSGQIPLDPQTLALVSDDFSTQVHQAFNNLKAVCQAAGGDLQDVVKLNLYLTDLSLFQTVNDIMMTYFTAPYPARATLGITSLPKGAMFEVDGVMVLNTVGMR